MINIDKIVYNRLLNNQIIILIALVKKVKYTLMDILLNNSFYHQIDFVIIETIVLLKG